MYYHIFVQEDDWVTISDAYDLRDLTGFTAYDISLIPNHQGHLFNAYTTARYKEFAGCVKVTQWPGVVGISFTRLQNFMVAFKYLYKQHLKEIAQAALDQA